MQTQRFGTGTILASVLTIVLLIVIPLITINDSEFSGADGRGSDIVAEIAPDYDSEWVTNIWEPPGSETESMLFALQATVGGLLIGYTFGYLRGSNSIKE